MTPEFTADARAILSDGPLLAPYQDVVVDDPRSARARARSFLAPFIGMGRYAKSLLRQPFSAADIADGGSDRLIDSVVARGTVDAVGARVQAHLDAGATHVALHAISPRAGLPHAEWAELAPLVRRPAGTAGARPAPAPEQVPSASAVAADAERLASPRPAVLSGTG
ncbi:hypothetical protein GCM10010300_81030 [Streptomyces olivaceoviridis]|uniref:hypothetical protein n=1 Tax=Streptomyces olivaceoviridis TaxID=1921 RepID=UPI00198A7E49|nr:hypothetical protein [Streptomyces olivaceoviridis]GGZ25361.1 hypothetical protein GCM10010300_81030 [Streptomyces olivaceoviridis]